jgi:hypothetical protein
MINRREKAKALRMSILALFLLLGLRSVGQAGPLGVIIDPYPDILAQSISSSYNATSGAFSATGWAMTLNTGTGPQNITTNFRLTATINSTTGIASVGTLTVGSALSPVLYSASLIGFAYNAVQGGALEFLFGSPTGSYVPTIYSSLQPIDVMLSAGVGFLGSFNSSWSGSAGTADIRPDDPAPNPEPSALLLMLVAGVGLCAGAFYNRRRGVALLGHYSN